LDRRQCFSIFSFARLADRYQFLGDIHKIAPGVAITLRELIDQLLDAKSGLDSETRVSPFFPSSAHLQV
jgi:hypothetical protein